MPMCWPIAAPGCCSFPKRCCRWSRTCVGRMPDLEHVVVSGKDAHGHKKLSDELAGESDVIRHRRDPSRRAGVLAVFVGFDRHAQGRASSAFQSGRDRGNLCASRCSASARTMSCLSAAKLFFAYGLGNALTFPMSVGATTVLNSERPTPAADVRADEQIQSDASSSACRRCSPRC